MTYNLDQMIEHMETIKDEAIHERERGSRHPNLNPIGMNTIIKLSNKLIEDLSTFKSIIAMDIVELDATMYSVQTMTKTSAEVATALRDTSLHNPAVQICALMENLFDKLKELYALHPARKAWEGHLEEAPERQSEPEPEDGW